jgi:hypothetical protein
MLTIMSTNTTKRPTIILTNDRGTVCVGVISIALLDFAPL